MLTTTMMTTIMKALAAATEVDEAAVAVVAMSSDYLFGASKLWMELVAFDFVFGIVKGLVASAKVLVAVLTT